MPRMDIFASTLLAFGGTWLLTAPDPTGSEELKVVWA